MSLKLAILASGSGSNAQVIFEAVKKGLLDVDIRLVLCNRPHAKVLERAELFGIPSICIDHTLFATREEFDTDICAKIKEAGADTIAMAGYMRMVTPYFLQNFAGRVINIHPAILPSFAGVSGAKDAVEYGVKVSGCSVHFVTDKMDAGPIIIQGIVPCTQNDSTDDLQKRIHTIEHRIYVQALQWMAQNRLSVVDRTVMLDTFDSKTHKATFLTDERYPLGALVYPPLEIGF